MIPVISDPSTIRTAVLQIIRSAAQWVAGAVLSWLVVQEGFDAFGLDPETVSDAIVNLVSLGIFLAYIAAVRILETYVHPALGWLNGWRADLGYNDDVIEVGEAPRL